VSDPGVEENSLSSSGFTRINVSRDPDISGMF
jgi:hypothetical protein